MQTETKLTPDEIAAWNYTGPLFKSFGDGSHYVMTGDYREVPCGVFTIRATIVPDYDSRPEDFGGCYTRKPSPHGLVTNGPMLAWCCQYIGAKKSR